MFLQLDMWTVIKLKSEECVSLYNDVWWGASQVALVVTNLNANTGDMRCNSIPGLARSLGRGHGNPLKYFCLENPHGQRSLAATVHEVTKSWTRLKWLNTHMAVLGNMTLSKVHYTSKNVFTLFLKTDPYKNSSVNLS